MIPLNLIALDLIDYENCEKISPKDIDAGIIELIIVKNISY